MATKFEDIDNDSFGALEGNSENVIANAYALDTGKALTETDLLTEGTYPLHVAPGQYTLMVHKFKNGNLKFEARVLLTAEKLFDEELQRDRHANELSAPDQRVKWNAPPWILALLLFEHDVHPDWDMAAFEKALYTHYNKFWLDEARAPKRLILT